MASYKPVAAVLRGLEILRLVSQGRRATVKALHAATGYDKATIVRMLETLIHAGYVVQDAEAGGYRVSGRVLQLASGYDRLQQSAELAAPTLARFRAEVGWPSDFALRDGDAMIVAGTSREPGPLAFNRRPGFRAPILETSIGRAYLAFCPEEERQQILAQLRAVGVRIPPAADLDALLAQVRDEGVAIMDAAYSEREYNGKLWAMAVPVCDGERVYGAINMMMLSQAVTEARARADYLPGLRQVAREVAAAFCAGGL